jgi:hypothetical protein
MMETIIMPIAVSWILMAMLGFVTVAKLEHLQRHER